VTDTATSVRPVTEDAFLGGALRVLQPQSGYRAGLDAVLLAAAAPVNLGQREQVLDVGAGVGLVGLAVARRIPDARITLVEREPELAALARANAERNGLCDRVRVIEADVMRRLSEFPDLSLGVESFDHVLANPPYHKRGATTAAATAAKAASHLMPAGDLERWTRFMTAMARPGGSATLIHKVEALPELLAALEGRFGALKVLPLHPRTTLPAIRVIVQGIKGSRAPLQILAGLTLHAEGGGFTSEAERLLRAGEPLAL
jgi:FkbM family methyltransferase